MRTASCGPRLRAEKPSLIRLRCSKPRGLSCWPALLNRNSISLAKQSPWRHMLAENTSSRQEQSPWSICCRRGQASAVITLRSGREARLATFSRECPSAKWLSNRSAAQRNRADTSGKRLVPDVAPLARIWADNPRLKAVMMENLACDIGRKLRRTNETIQYTRKMTRTHRAVQGQL